MDVIWNEVLETAQQISDIGDRAEMLSELAEVGPKNHLDMIWDEVLETSRQIGNEGVRASVLSRLAEHGPDLRPASGTI